MGQHLVIGFIEEFINLEPAARRITQQAGKRLEIICRPTQRRQAAVRLKSLVANQEGNALVHRAQSPYPEVAETTASRAACTAGISTLRAFTSTSTPSARLS